MENESIIRSMLTAIGENPDREGLLDTPKRVVKSWRELFSGYDQNPATILERDFEGGGYDEMIVLRDIELYSMCEHHMLPFYGRAHVAYIPGARVVGLSKLARVVECFARRLQIQEKLTRQIADAINEFLNPKGVGVIIEAQHMCMVARGVGKQNSVMTTSALIGKFRDSEVRAEFFNLTGRS
jgi:GTP cyclohydrolase I